MHRWLVLGFFKETMASILEVSGACANGDNMTKVFELALSKKELGLFEVEIAIKSFVENCPKW